MGMHQKGISAARLGTPDRTTGGKFDDSAYKDERRDGVGSSVVNALSVYMDVQISREGYIHHDREHQRGVPVVELEDGLLPTIGKDKKDRNQGQFFTDSF